MLLRKKLWIGVDLGTSGIKFVKLNGRRIEDWGSMNLPEGTISMGVIKNASVLSGAIKELANKHDLRKGKVVTSIGGRDAIIKPIVIPKVEKGEFEKFLAWEIERHLPFPSDEAVYNYQIYRSFVEENESKVEILIVATRRSLARHIYDIFYDTGIELEAIEVTPFPFFRMVELSDIQQPFMLMDIGAGKTDVAVVKDGQLVLFRSILLGGNLFTSSISASLNIGFSEAEELKKNNTFGDLREHMEDIVANFMEEITKCFNFIIGQFKENIVNKIYITGGGSSLRGFDIAIENVFGIPVKKLDPLKGISLVDSGIGGSELRSRWSLALGLALRGVY